MVQVLGYVVGDVIGRGGFATVYRANQASVGRDVALKVLNAADITAEELEQFRAECAALAQLGWNRNVVQILDAGITDDGRPFLAMELLDGGSVVDLVRSGRIPEVEVRKCGAQVASALAAAHAIGVLHRDVKPDNVLLDRGGNYRLADFGIASLATGTRTATGMVSGTVAFMAPEIVLGRRASPQSDIFSLGATLYTLASGSSPFGRAGDESPASALHRIVNEDPPSLESLGVSGSLAAIIQNAMYRDPGRRYPSAEHFERELAAESTLSADSSFFTTVSRASLAELPTAAPTTVLNRVGHVGAVAPLSAGPPVHASGRTGRLVAIVAVATTSALVVAAGIAAAILLARRPNPTRPVAAAPTAVPIVASSVTASSATSALPALSTTAVPVITSLAPVASTTTVPVTTSTTATTIAPPTTKPPVVAAVTATLSTEQPTAPTEQLPTDYQSTAVSADEAASFLRAYFLTAGARDYPRAWAMCTARYQAKYVSYDRFVRFWDTVEFAGIDATHGLGVTDAGSALLQADVWFKGFSATTSKESVRIEVLSADGMLMLDDYVFLGPRP